LETQGHARQLLVHFDALRIASARQRVRVFGPFREAGAKPWPKSGTFKSGTSMIVRGFVDGQVLSGIFRIWQQRLHRDFRDLFVSN
jgi:hypothetical protein